MLYVIKRNNLLGKRDKVNIPAEREREEEAAADSWRCSDVRARVAEADCSSHTKDSSSELQRCQGAQPQGMNPHRAIFCSAPAQGSDRLTVLRLQLQLPGTLVLHVRQVPM